MAAFSGSTVWEIRNVADYVSASDTNGGGFVTGASGTDYSYASLPAGGAPKYSLTNGVAATGSATIATTSASSDMVGNVAYISGGTGSITGNWYQIISQITSTSITVNASTGLVTGSSVNIVIGGCLATPGGLGAVLAAVGVTGMRAYWRYSTTAYTMLVATSNAATGLLTLPSGIVFTLEGYDQARGDRTGNRPQISWGSVSAPGGNTYMIVCVGVARQAILNVNANGNSVNNVSGINMSAGARCFAEDCVVQNCSGTNAIGYLSTSGTTGLQCQANTCLSGFTGAGSWDDCDAVACATVGYIGFTTVNKSLARAGAGSCTTGFSCTVVGAFVGNSLADSCGTGIDLSGVTGATAESSIVSNCTGGAAIGFKVGTGSVLLNNASYNNTNEISGTPQINEGTILAASFGGSPYVSQAGGDFRPNATAGAGALLRGAGIGVFGQTDNVDIGAVQHSDPTGGGLTGRPMMVSGQSIPYY